MLFSFRSSFPNVIPAKAGIQKGKSWSVETDLLLACPWIPCQARNDNSGAMAWEKM